MKFRFVWICGMILAFAAVVKSADFGTTRFQAEKTESPLLAVTLWQNYLDQKPTPSDADLTKAKAELALWQKRADDNAEKINGKWVGGEERDKILAQVKTLFDQANDLMRANQTIAAVKKLEEGLKIYPNSFPANYMMGFINLQQSKYDAAVKNLEMAVKLKPQSAEAYSNLAIAQCMKKQYQPAILSAYKATELKDSKPIVQNLVNTLAAAPPGIQKNSAIKPAVEAANLLAGKYGIAGPGNWLYLNMPMRDADPLPEPGKKGGDRPSNLPAGVVGNGSGLLISDDGLILTNKHVAGEGDTLLVRLSDGTQRRAEVVVIDDDQDLALIRIKSQKKLPFISLAGADVPNPGAECTALGFPLGNVLRMTLQVTPGTVSSVIPTDTSDVVVTCKVNPGNSGGPLVDKFGNVIGVVTQKTFATEVVESYGKAISAGKIRSFLAKHQAKHGTTLAAGASGEKSLSTEEIYQKVSPAAVCIVMIRGKTTP